jgi:hypothetical protein
MMRCSSSVSFLWPCSTSLTADMTGADQCWTGCGLDKEGHPSRWPVCWDETVASIEPSATVEAINLNVLDMEDNVERSAVDKKEMIPTKEERPVDC